MLVVPLEPCAKCYAFVFMSKLFSQTHTPYHITVVITNIKKQLHRSAKKQFGINLNLNDNLMFRGLFLVATLKIKQNQLENK